MGGKNKARKTRWRALDITDDHNSDDSEESNLTSSSALSSGRVPNGYHSNNSRPHYSSKYSYSSQSTPRRRFYEGTTRSTRSSSTASETKITLIDDEYTRITTPRQDVLFKKGYLNKPKVYQSQTSTGASTVSTENSTENGTPDHQSTDLDYESQFVFPNGFVDQNGIYYVNSYEPYPLMLFNPPTYFHEFSDQKLTDHKSKRYSTGSLTESMSPNTEEATSQDLSHSGGDTSNNVSDYGGQPLYNLVYPGYYMNSGPCPTNGPISGHVTEPVKKLRKRRERNSSKTVPGDSTENTTDETSADEESHTKSRVSRQTTPLSSTPNETSTQENVEESSENHVIDINKENSTTFDNAPSLEETTHPNPILDTENLSPNVETKQETPVESKTESSITQNGCVDPKTDITQENNINNEINQAQPNEIDNQQECKPEMNLSQSNLKPEAEEFVPRGYRTLPAPPAHIIPSNFVPIPLVLNDFGGQPFATHQAFIPTGIPINIMPPPHPGHKMFPPIFGPPHHLPHKIEEISASHLEKITEDKNNITRTPESTPPNSALLNNKIIDIATVVSKLEEAVKEREENLKIEEQLQKTLPHENVNYRGSNRFPRQPYRKTFNKYKTPLLNSAEYPPINRVKHVQNSRSSSQEITKPVSVTENKIEETVPIQTPDTANKVEQCEQDKANTMNPNPVLINENNTDTKENQSVTNSPEKVKRNWNQNHTYQGNQNSPKRQSNFRRSNSENTVKPNSREYSQQRSLENKSVNKNYSEMLKKPTQFNDSNRKHINENKNANVKKYSTVSSSVTTSPNQWVAVSSRKKKRIQNVEDCDLEEPSETVESNAKMNDECFEPYDVNQLEDVVPSQESKGEGVINDLEDKHAVVEVRGMEKDTVTPNEDCAVETLVEPQKLESEDIRPVVDNDIEKSKKKSKKNTQKPLTRRVIIKDIDLSGEHAESDSKATENVEKEKPSIKTNKTAKTETKKGEETSSSSNVKQKPKKKKKSKTLKSNLNDDSSDLNTTTSTVEESCDLLLENSLLNTSLEKTNVEMTAELDKLIQKSMFSSLKDKIRSVDLDSFDDEFFQKLGTSSGSKNGFNKTPDFNKIFQSTRQFLKPNSAEITNSWNLPATDYPDAQPGEDPAALCDLTKHPNPHDSIEIRNSTHIPHDASPEPDQAKSEARLKSAADICSPTIFNAHHFDEEQEQPHENQDYEETLLIADDQKTIELLDEDKELKKENEKDQLNEGNDDSEINLTTIIAHDQETSIQQNQKHNEQSVDEEEEENQANIDLKLAENKENESQDLKQYEDPGTDTKDIDESSTSSDLKVRVVDNQKKLTQATQETNADEREKNGEADRLHPITSAVKIWMTRTREVTPEIELLKSPATIYKELRASVEREDDSSDEEVVIFKTEIEELSRKSSSQESDLLEYWENEIKETPIVETSLVKDTCTRNESTELCACAKCQKNEIEEGIEVYKSKYGHNEALSTLQKQIEENDETTGARYGQLPDRAICCNLQ